MDAAPQPPDFPAFARGIATAAASGGRILTDQARHAVCHTLHSCLRCACLQGTSIRLQKIQPSCCGCVLPEGTSCRSAVHLEGFCYSRLEIMGLRLSHPESATFHSAAVRWSRPGWTHESRGSCWQSMWAPTWSRSGGRGTPRRAASHRRVFEVLAAAGCTQHVHCCAPRR